VGEKFATAKLTHLFVKAKIKTTALLDMINFKERLNGIA
jgi:hypothetical protein